MLDHYYAVIMAGGGGTRLWPLSRKGRPKQILRLTGDKTLFQLAVDRVEPLFTAERILVVTVAEQRSELSKLCPQIPAQNFLPEPLPRGTASVVGLAAVAIQHRDPQAVMAVLTADHSIENIALFRELLKSGYLAAQEDSLVTIGIQPTFPATGYGYIEGGDDLGEFESIPIKTVSSFKEKPDEDTARRFLESGRFYWNSGMFIWGVERILREIKKSMPELAGQLKQVSEAWGTERQDSVLSQVWTSIKPMTIDYGIMEKADQVVVIPAEKLGWSDVGSWDSLFYVYKGDASGNINLNSKVLNIETTSSLIVADNPRKLIATIGVDNLVIIETDDAILICKREESQKVKQLVESLKKNDLSSYL